MREWIKLFELIALWTTWVLLTLEVSLKTNVLGPSSDGDRLTVDGVDKKVIYLRDRLIMYFQNDLYILFFLSISFSCDFNI